MERIGAATGGGILVSYALVQAALAGLVVLPPLALVLLIASLLAVSGLSYIQAEARGWVAAHKEDLVCAIYNAEDATTARADVWAYLDDEWDVAGDPQFVKMLFSNWLLANLFDGSLAGYDEWSGDYSAGYCGVCVTPALPFTRQTYFNPCPQEWTGTGVCWSIYGETRMCLNGGAFLESISGSWYWGVTDLIDVVLEAQFFSKYGYGNTVGYLTLDRSADGLTGWAAQKSATLTTLEAVGIPTTKTQEWEDYTITPGYYRLRLNGQAGQGDSYPFPLMTVRVKCIFKEPD